jgi:hypothetical protein
MRMPERGERVKLRGRKPTGVLVKYDPETNWATVEWDTTGPRCCHRAKLEVDR